MKTYIGSGYIENSNYYYNGKVVNFIYSEHFRSALMLIMAKITESVAIILDPLCFIATNNNGNQVSLVKNTEKVPSEDFIDLFNEYLLHNTESSYRRIIGYLLFLSHKTEDKENNEALPLVNFLLNISESGLVDKEEHQIYLNSLLEWQEIIKKDKIIKGINDHDFVYDEPKLKIKPDTHLMVEDFISLKNALELSESDTIINSNKNTDSISLQIKNTNKFINYKLKQDDLYESLLITLQAGFSVFHDQTLQYKYRIESLIEKDHKYISLRAIPNISNYKIEDLIYESKSC